MRVDIFIITILALGVHCQEWYEVGNPHFLDTNTIFPAVKDTTSIKIVKFFSPWCKYCRYVKAFMDNFKKSHQINPNLKFYEFDCQKNGANFCWQHFQVRAYPCVIIVDERGETISRMDGLYPEDVINNILDDLNNKAKALGEAKVDDQKNQGQEKKQQKKEQGDQKKQEIQEEAKKQEQNKKQEQKKVEEKKQEQNKQPPKQEKPKQEKKQEEVQAKQQQKKEQKIEVKHQQATKQQVVPAKPTPAPQHEKKVETPTPAQPTPQKVNKQQLSEQSVDKEAKVDPSNPQSETKFVQQPKNEESYQFVKYFLYLVGISVGVLYAIKIFSSKGQESLNSTRKSQLNPEQANKKPLPKITARDIENQILVQEVPDENL